MSKQSYYRSLIRTAMKKQAYPYPKQGTQEWEKVRKNLKDSMNVVVDGWRKYAEALKEVESYAKKYYGDTLSDVRRFTKRGADTALYRKQDAMGVMDDEFVFEKIFVRYDEENEGE